jgi:hypothetical protein
MTPAKRKILASALLTHFNERFPDWGRKVWTVSTQRCRVTLHLGEPATAAVVEVTDERCRADIHGYGPTPHDPPTPTGRGWVEKTVLLCDLLWRAELDTYEEHRIVAGIYALVSRYGDVTLALTPQEVAITANGITVSRKTIAEALDLLVV